MSFIPGLGRPKIPDPIPPANPAIQPDSGQPVRESTAPATASLISTSTQGLRRRASTQRRSLIGGV